MEKVSLLSNFQRRFSLKGPEMSVFCLKKPLPISFSQKGLVQLHKNSNQMVVASTTKGKGKIT